MGEAVAGRQRERPVDLITAYSNRGDLAFELATALRKLGKAQEADSSERLSVRSTGRSERTWRVEDQLDEVNLKLMIKQYQEGATARELAEQYKISLSSVRRLLRKYGGRLKDE